MPADHEARSQVKKEDSCKSEGTQRRLHPKERMCTAVQCKKEASRIRRAIAANRSANDTAKQATMTRETDMSAEHKKET